MDDLEQLNETLSDAAQLCDIDANPAMRLTFTSFGTAISLIGCVCNSLLLYVLVCRPPARSSFYQTFLALLDFAMCFSYIACFGAVSMSVVFRIDFLYAFLKRYSMEFYIGSRIVQLSIPYVLIASSAERLAWVMGAHVSERGFGRFAVCLLISAVVVVLRLPGYYAAEVADLGDGCDFFHRQILMPTELAGNSTYKMFDVIVSFFHLFVSFVILLLLNCIIINKIRKCHQKARRQSSCPQAVLSANKAIAMEEERKEAKRLRAAIKTTIVIISSYLACNSVNFVLYSMEMFNYNLIWNEEAGDFYGYYVFASDLGTNLFVFCSTIRIFILYKYNPELRAQIRSVRLVGAMMPRVEVKKEISANLLGVNV